VASEGGKDRVHHSTAHSPLVFETLGEEDMGHVYNGIVDEFGGHSPHHFTI
jgi:hypothetical protein